MNAFSILAALDHDVEVALKTAAEYYGVTLSNAKEVALRMSQTTYENGGIDWKVDGHVVLRFRRGPMKGNALTYTLEIVQQKQKSRLVVAANGSLILPSPFSEREN